MSETGERLLVDDQEEEWDAVEEGVQHQVTVQELIRQDPEHVLAYIKRKGVAKLGEFKIQDDVILAALGEETMLTMGADSAVIDYEAAWRRQIAKKHGALQSTGWSRMVTVEAFVVTIKDAAAADVEGLVHPILKRWQGGACHWSVFALPAVQAVVEFKWDSWGAKVTMAECLMFLTWLFSFSVFMLVFQDEDTSLSLPELLQTGSGIVTVVAEVVSLVAMLPFLAIELGTLLAYSIWGWLNIWNALDVATYVLQVAISVLHLGRINLNSGTLSVMVATQCVLLWFRLNYFSRVFGRARFSFVDSLRQVIYDIRFYLFFLMLMMWGFACSYCILFRKDQEYQQFSDIGHSLLTMFNYALGGVELDIMLNSSNPRAALMLSVVYQFAMSMVLMNLLIGVMCSSVEKATSHEDLKQILSKAQVVDELESTFPKWLEWMFLRNCYPAYVHVLRVDPKSMDPIPDSSSLWAGKSKNELPAAVAAGGGGDGDIKTLLSEVEGLRQQVDRLADILNTAVPSYPGTPVPASPER